MNGCTPCTRWHCPSAYVGVKRSVSAGKTSTWTTGRSPLSTGSTGWPASSSSARSRPTVRPAWSRAQAAARRTDEAPSCAGGRARRPPRRAGRSGQEGGEGGCPAGVGTGLCVHDHDRYSDRAAEREPSFRRDCAPSPAYGESGSTTCGTRARRCCRVRVCRSSRSRTSSGTLTPAPRSHLR